MAYIRNTTASSRPRVSIGLEEAVRQRTGLAYENHSALKAKEPPESSIPILAGLFSRPPIVEISALLRQ